MNIGCISALAAVFGAALFAAGPAGAQNNGWGVDADGDGNPATNARGIYRIGDAAEAALDPPYRVITFEAPPGRHGEPLGLQYAKEFGVRFGRGLSRQICEGQRYFQYDSQCTYRRAPSGRFAAVYRDDWGYPLEISFAAPVCVAALAIYPTGGKEGEHFRVRIQPYAADGKKLPRANVRFQWTKDTFRWRLMAGAYMLGERATRIEVDIESVDNRKKPVRFLIDDVAFVEEGCEAALAEIVDAAEAAPPRPSGGGDPDEDVAP